MKPNQRISNADVFLPPPARVRKKVIVIGGGVNGALAALELVRMGHYVTLIEAGSIGNGSSSRSAACIRQQFGTPSNVRGMKYCIEYYKHLPEITGIQENPLKQNGYLFLKDWTTDVRELESLVAMQNEAGLKDVRILTVDEIVEMFPYINPVGITGATWCPTDGYLYPAVIYTSAIEAAKREGAVVVTNDAVKGVEFLSGHAKSVSTLSGRTFFGEIFVNTAGVWAPKVSSYFGGVDLEIRARRRYLYFADGSSNSLSRTFLTKEVLPTLPMIITPNGGYCRPESGRSPKIMMGWLQYANPVEPRFEEQDIIEKGYGINNLDEYGLAVHKEIHRHIPDIEQMPLHSVTSGFYEDTPDHNPFIGYDSNVPNLIHCAGFSGHGLMHGPFSARIVGHLINAGRDLDEILLPGIGEVDIATFQINRKYANAEGMVI